VFVDEVGIGYNFALQLSDHDFPVFRFNADHRAIDAERFVNAKAESYWGSENGWSRVKFVGSMISKQRRSYRRSFTGRRRRVKRKSRARKTRGSEGSRHPIAPRRWSWLSAKSCRARGRR
jgi:hypothetical protein